MVQQKQYVISRRTCRPCLKESTVRGWKTTYLRELATKVKAEEEDMSIERFPATEKGRPLLLGQDLDR